MTLRGRWLLLALVCGLPYVILMAAGAYWIFQSGWWWGWLALTAVSSLVVWLAVRRARRTQQEKVGPHPLLRTVPSPYWPPAGRIAWEKIEKMAVEFDTDAYPLERPEPAWDLLHRILEIAAQEFHPGMKFAVAAVPVPHVLRIIELVSHDLRESLATNVPGAHIFTLRDLQKLQQWSQWLPWVHRAYRVGAAFLNPPNAVMRELANWAQGDLLDFSTRQTKHWLLQSAIRQAGFYAIELYSGQLVLHDLAAGESTGTSAGWEQTARRRQEALETEPFRILVLGQVKAGKSSLVNALFGETRAAVDVVPRTRHVEPYLLERDGLRKAIILDTAGYDDAATPDAPSQQATSEALKSDLIVLVTSAQTAARAADRRLLEAWRARFQATPDREFPPVVGVLTHIDQLRPFREWDPPYDLRDAQNQKSRNIRAALETAAEELGLPVTQIVPVCLLAGQVYNVETGLVPLILEELPAADRVRYLRCLKEFHDQEYWRKLGEQAVNGGRILWQFGRHLYDMARKERPPGSSPPPVA